MEEIDCPETSVSNYNYKLRNIAEERRSNLFRANAENQA